MFKNRQLVSLGRVSLSHNIYNYEIPLNFCNLRVFSTYSMYGASGICDQHVIKADNYLDKLNDYMLKCQREMAKPEFDLLLTEADIHADLMQIAQSDKIIEDREMLFSYKCAHSALRITVNKCKEISADEKAKSEKSKLVTYSVLGFPIVTVITK